MEDRSRRCLWLAASLALTSGCKGVIGETRSAGYSDSGAPDAGPRPCGIEVAAAPLRRLTRAEYRQTVADLLGPSSTDPTAPFPADEKVGPFDTNLVAPVSDLAVDDYMGAAESLAATVAARVDALLPCDRKTTSETECAVEFIADFGQRAFRRPLAADEAARYQALFDAKRARSDFAGGIALCVQAMLQSPNFLYHVERGLPGPGPVVPLAPYEMASRLSYFFWGAPPDSALLDAARNDLLSSKDEVEAQARRLLASDRAHAAVRTFHVQWLGIDKLKTVSKDATAYPEFDRLRNDMRLETEAFVDEVVWRQGGRLETLLTAPYSFPDGRLLPLYGLDGPADAPPTRTNLDSRRRAGVLTQPALLAVHDGVVRRGKFVRNALLCQQVSPPPPGVNTNLPPPDPSLSIRKRFQIHESNPVCGSCHRMMDPIGFGFLNFDEIGRFGTMEGSLPVDATGEIVGLTSGAGTFDGPVALARLLAASPEVHGCAVVQWFRFALGRDPQAQDQCAIAAATAAFTRSQHDVRELMVEIARSDPFRFIRIDR